MGTLSFDVNKQLGDRCFSMLVSQSRWNSLSIWIYVTYGKFSTAGISIVQNSTLESVPNYIWNIIHMEIQQNPDRHFPY